MGFYSLTLKKTSKKLEQNSIVLNNIISIASSFCFSQSECRIVNRRAQAVDIQFLPAVNRNEIALVLKNCTCFRTGLNVYFIKLGLNTVNINTQSLNGNCTVHSEYIWSVLLQFHKSLFKWWRMVIVHVAKDFAWLSTWFFRIFGRYTFISLCLLFHSMQMDPCGLLITMWHFASETKEKWKTESIHPVNRRSQWFPYLQSQNPTISSSVETNWFGFSCRQIKRWRWQRFCAEVNAIDKTDL